MMKIMDLDEFDNASPEHQYEAIINLKRSIEAILFHLRAIEEENDPEVCNTYIEAISLIQGEVLGHPTREAIRLGIGDYKRIQAKCINMGIV